MSFSQLQLQKDVLWILKWSQC